MLILSLTAALSLSSLAAPQLVDRTGVPVSLDLPVVDELVAAQGPSGTLTGVGEIKVNGNPAQTGATVLSGNTIETGRDGDASIEMAQLGRVQLRPSTEIKLTMESGRYEVLVEDCGSVTATVPAGVSAVLRMAESQLTEVAVTRGEVRVRAGGSDEVLKAGESKTFQGGIESVTASGDAIFTVNCCECEVPGAGLIWPGFWWVLGAAATAAAIPIAIEVGDEDVPRPISPIRP
jgi:hypothetical protein